VGNGVEGRAREQQFQGSVGAELRRSSRAPSLVEGFDGLVLRGSGQHRRRRSKWRRRRRRRRKREKERRYAGGFIDAAVACARGDILLICLNCCCYNYHGTSSG
jgi:hypothetical protein